MEQNLDMTKLEKSGSLQIIYLSFDGDDNSDNLSKLTWQQLVQWQSDGYFNITRTEEDPALSTHDPSSFVLMIDDLEMFELLSPTPSDARQFINNALLLMDDCNRPSYYNHVNDTDR